MESSFDLLNNLEIREMIYSYCKVPDLVNFACCSKAHYKSVVYLIWYAVTVPWCALATKLKTLPVLL